MARENHSWYTEVSSLLLQRFSRQDLKSLIATIEHCATCKSAFLRGFYDSEGSIRARRLTVYNGDLNKLELVCALLTSLRIKTTGPRPRKEKGGMVLIKGKMWHVNKDQYYVYVRTESLSTFDDRIGFTIARKRDRLERAVQHQRNCSKSISED